jgi:hypothetical protein
MNDTIRVSSMVDHSLALVVVNRLLEGTGR